MCVCVSAGVVEEWRKQWYLSKLYVTSDWEKLEKKLLERNEIQKLKAILTCSRAKRSQRMAVHDGAVVVAKVPDERPLPARIFTLLVRFLNDTLLDLKVKRAAAICLFTLEYYKVYDCLIH